MKIIILLTILLVSCETSVLVDKNENKIEKALLLCDSGKFEESLLIIHKLIETRDSNSELWYNAGYIYSKKGEFSKSYDSYLNALRYNYKNEDTLLFNLAVVSFEMGDYQNSIVLCNYLLGISPYMASAYNIRGSSYIMLGDTVCACSNYRRSALMGNVYSKKNLKEYCQAIDSMLTLNCDSDAYHPPLQQTNNNKPTPMPQEYH